MVLRSHRKGERPGIMPRHQAHELSSLNQPLDDRRDSDGGHLKHKVVCEPFLNLCLIIRRFKKNCYGKHNSSLQIKNQ